MLQGVLGASLGAGACPGVPKHPVGHPMLPAVPGARTFLCFPLCCPKMHPKRRHPLSGGAPAGAKGREGASGGEGMSFGLCPHQGTRFGGLLLLNSKVRAAGPRNAGCLISEWLCLLPCSPALGSCSWQGAPEKDQNSGSPRARPYGGPGPGARSWHWDVLGRTGARDRLGQHSCCGGHWGEDLG